MCFLYQLNNCACMYIMIYATYEVSVLYLKRRNNTTFVSLLSNCLQVKIFYDWCIVFTISVYDYYAIGLSSVYSTRALFHKYCVAMKYTRISIFLILCESTIKNTNIPLKLLKMVSSLNVWKACTEYQLIKPFWFGRC